MRVIGIIRQSKGSDDALSPGEQRERIRQHCDREGFELVEVREEIDVSGGTPLAKRLGLGPAVERIEAGDAQVLLVAYFDRLCRSLSVQTEVVERVDAAGGRVLALDFGRITGATAAQWLSSTLLGAVNEYQRRSTGERLSATQAIAIANGVPTWNATEPGYTKGPDKRLAPDADAPVMAEAFRRRAAGATIREIRAYLAGHGIRRSYHGVQHLLRSPVYVGELHFGELVNTDAHEAIVDREVWDAVQAMRGERGARPKSDRLLARLGILRCGTCGARMVVGVKTVPAQGKRYALYRCPPVGDCPRRVTIGAEIAERFAVERTKEALVDLEGRASADQRTRDAEAALEKAQADLDAAIRVFQGLADEATAVERLRELRDARDAAAREVSHLGRLSVALRIRVNDWPILTLDEQRDLIRATIERIEVAPGRGDGRLSCQPLV